MAEVQIAKTVVVEQDGQASQFTWFEPRAGEVAWFDGKLYWDQYCIDQMKNPFYY